MKETTIAAYTRRACGLQYSIKKTTMLKNILYIALFTLLGCAGNTERVYIDANGKEYVLSEKDIMVDGKIAQPLVEGVGTNRGEYNGHKYTYFEENHGGRSWVLSVLHDPDCEMEDMRKVLAEFKNN
jgi:hypothetical protein